MTAEMAVRKQTESRDIKGSRGGRRQRHWRDGIVGGVRPNKGMHVRSVFLKPGLLRVVGDRELRLSDL